MEKALDAQATRGLILQGAGMIAPALAGKLGGLKGKPLASGPAPVSEPQPTAGRPLPSHTVAESSLYTRNAGSEPVVVKSPAPYETVPVTVKQPVAGLGLTAAERDAILAAGKGPRVGVPNTETTRGVLGPNAGTYYATEILPGGSGQAIAGHGELRRGSGYAVVPDGTTLVLPKTGIKISDTTGRVLETIDLERLAAAGPKARNRLIREHLDDMDITNSRIRNRVIADLQDLQVVKPGNSVPNFTVKTPDGLKIFQNSTTVELSTPLRDLLRPNAGVCGLATCTEFRW
ncbi:hypothetical protein HNQ59_003901 [Chitinivorax tropicus]|uniref:Putative adhesin Stv domain-containing protein n=1 Tax=Chitinivorax tropicus TaxID=714531 RepID=A0A840MQ65_9PROT|nr:hypothetical protein [Chitinivorax tropicus]MBB5020580.1 hypothetical protein [Chitinivorax tropicus]